MSVGAIFTCAVALLLSLLAANAIAWFLQHKRGQRIQALAAKLAAPSRDKTPITLVTGFLGAGKTTLVNHVLRTPDVGRRIAVIENEVGSISIDHALLKEGEEAKAQEGIFVLKNGCMCCSAAGPGDELERVLDKLLMLLDAKEYGHVIIEASGLADPGPIIQFFLQHRMARSRFYLDSVLAVVDAKNIAWHLVGGFRTNVQEAQRQIAFADTVLINKRDLVTSSELQTVVERVLAVNPTARLLFSERAVVDLDDVLGVGAFDVDKVTSLTRAFESCTECGTSGDAHAHARHASTCGSSPARHTEGVRAVCFQLDPPLDSARFTQWLTELVQQRWQQLYRVKALLHVAGSDRQLLVQGVMAQVQGGMHRQWAAGQQRKSQLVFIGVGLDEEELRQGVMSCIATPQEAVSTAPQTGTSGMVAPVRRAPRGHDDS